MDSTEKLVFEKLTPLDDHDIGIYKSAIDFAFEHSDIRNIAISGAYGAGKSSVLASYEKAYPGRKFIHISLAHFQNLDEADGITGHNADANAMLKSDASGSPKIIRESLLEGKILNQLIHQIPADKIPQTNFRVKKSISKREPIVHTFLIALFIVALFRILFFDQWRSMVCSLPEVLRALLVFSTTPTAEFVSGVLCVSIAAYFLYRVVYIQENKNIFRKLSIQGNEIEIFEDSEDSFFDKYLNEVLYLFENADADVIVFEDMDRFDASEIFERLREINTLANIQRIKDGKQPLRFFYLLRDDIFISKDRTKFFDLIIPIVPVVDSSNSYDQFIEHLKKNNLFDKFDENFLQGLSLYVDDMRLLKNICNEFLVYYGRLDLTELDHNKMLAIITYKNLFPRDFGDLQLNRGFVYALFENKDKFISDEIAGLRTEIEALKGRLKSASREVATSEQELDVIFRNRRSYGLVNDSAEYDRRKQAIADNSQGTIPALENEVLKRENQIDMLFTAPLARIITRDNIDRIFSGLTTRNELGQETKYEEIKRSEYFDLLKYLIRNGYIDETYADYMTYFYENSLSRIDKIFLRSVSDKKAKSSDYRLSKPSMVLRRLRPYDFDQEETLNFMLCDELLSDGRYNEHLRHLIQQIKNNNKYQFLSQLFNYNHHEKEFVCAFNNQWPSIFADIQVSDEFSEDQVKKYSVLSLYYSCDEVLEKVEKASHIAEYINKKPDYLNIDAPQVDRLIHGFKLLKVSFATIDYNISDKTLYEAVYRNDLYDLNFSNIEMVLGSLFGNTIDDTRHKSYTLICADRESPLYIRIDKNIQAYIGVIFEECQEKITDDEDCAIELLNRNDIEVQYKNQYINYLQTPIQSLARVADRNTWEKIVSSDILLPSERNVIDYFNFKGGIDSTLIGFINKAEIEFDFSEKNTGLPEAERSILFDSFINCNGLADDKYSAIMSSLGIEKASFNIANIDDSKVAILIRHDIVVMNVDTLQFFRGYYHSCLYMLISKHIMDYMQLMTRRIFEYEELCEILTWDIDDSIKLGLLEFTAAPVSITGKNLSPIVRAYILRNNLDQSDLENLYRSYVDEPQPIKEIIFNNAVDNITRITYAPQSVSAELLYDIIVSDAIANPYKVDLIIADISCADRTEISKYLFALHLDEFVKIFDSRSRPKFENTSDNVAILNAFKARGWIYDYILDEAGYFKIRRHAPRLVSKTN